MEFITAVNALKKKYKVFKEDNVINVIPTDNDKVFAMLKVLKDGTEKALVIINADTSKTQHVRVSIAEVMGVAVKNKMDVSIENSTKRVPVVFDQDMRCGQVKLYYYQDHL